MGNILDKIVDHKRDEVEKRKKAVPLENFKDEIGISEVSFYDSLKGKNRLHLIAEIKYASPSRGEIIEFSEDHLLRTTQIYNRYASAISVLTDEHFFGGSHDNLRIARENSYLPLLCKDFIIDTYQVYEARRFGADAILLIASILSVNEMVESYGIAGELGMDVLFEVHDEEELEKVLEVRENVEDNCIIGVNNRNLKDFSIDLGLTKKLAERIPDDCVVVAESGIGDGGDVDKIRGIADAMLVGSSIMGSTQSQDELPEKQQVKACCCNPMILKSEDLTGLPRVKICGITNLIDALEAVKCGASYLGLIFAESPRKIGIKQAKKIIEGVRKISNVKIGGVVMTQEELEMMREIDLDFVQLHNEDLEVDKIEEKEIWKVMGISEELKIKNYELKINRKNYFDVLLFDTVSRGQAGGTGRVFDWNILEKTKKELLSKIPPPPLSPRSRDRSRGQRCNINFPMLALAGGVKADNIQKARGYADIIDVGSGVEREREKRILKS